MTDHESSAAQGCLGDSESSRILKMIEAVDPNDTVALNEIDARVKCYVTAAYKSEFVAMVDRGALYGKPDNRLSGYYERSTYEGKTETRDVNLIVRYTRSRDALKAIRPEGWKSWAFFDGYKEGAKFRAEMFSPHDTYPNNTIQTGWLPAEELAELHAIIQAIAYDRSIE